MTPDQVHFGQAEVIYLPHAGKPFDTAFHQHARALRPQATQAASHPTAVLDKSPKQTEGNQA